jgi:PhnB protein
MAMKKKTGTKSSAVKRAVRPVPRGFTTVTPYMNQADAAATIAFCKKAFGAKLRSKMVGPNKKIMHAELDVGDGIVMLSDAMMEPPRASSIFLYVPNVDKTVAKAAKAGATVVMPPADQFWGDRFARITDPQGNNWSIATHIENVRPAEMKTRMKQAVKEMAKAGAGKK